MTKPRSAWELKYTSYGFFHFLIQIGLTTRQVPKKPIEAMIRRHRSQYDRSSGESLDFYDGGLI